MGRFTATWVSMVDLRKLEKIPTTVVLVAGLGWDEELNLRIHSLGLEVNAVSITTVLQDGAT